MLKLLQFNGALLAPPTATTGLASGPLWVDSAAGNVLKRVA